MSSIGDTNSIAEVFIEETRRFCKEFDSLAENLFNGEQLEKLVLQFIDKHKKWMSQFAFPYSDLNLETATQMDCFKDDFRLMNLACNEEESSQEVTSINSILAQIYCRASKASYLRATYNLSRKRQEDNRQVPVDWARRAIRYDLNNFEVIYWFMIAIGWQVDAMPSSKERIIISQIFKLSTLRCIELNPESPLAHHLLGRYYFNVGNLTWFERAIIKTLLLHDTSGQFKIEGSHAEAEQTFLHAHKLKDDWPPTGLWMARTLLAQKRPLDEVKQWIQMGLSCECKEPTTELEHEELLQLKSKLKIA